MKLKKLMILAMVAVLAVMVLASCNKDPEPESGSKKPEESSSQTAAEMVKVTFKWGVEEWGDGKSKEDTPDSYKYSKVLEYEKGSDANPADIDFSETLSDVEGYEFNGWDLSFSDLRELEEDVVVSAVYVKLEKFTYTFKNEDGTVILTGEAWENSAIADKAPKASDAVYYFTSSQKSSLSDPVIHKVNGTTYWIEKADQEKLGKSLVMPIGSIFVDWKSSAVGTTINRLQSNNAVFTARLSAADQIIERIEPGTITKDNMLDKSLYKQLDTKFYKNIISNQNRDAADPEAVDCAIIDQYADLAAATAAGKAAEYTAALTQWNKYALGMDAIFYMAWDGDFIYFMAEVTDDTVVTNGKAYCAIDNPYENDGVEVWYAINNEYHKLCLDACGYRLFSGWEASAYLDYVAQQGLAKSKVTNASGATIDISGSDAPRVITGATGYTVAFALPAYEEPTDTTADLNNRANWGKKLSRGDTFYVSLQLDNVSAPALDSTLQAVIALRNDADPKNDLSITNYNKSEAGLAAGGAANNVAISRIHIGWQSQKKVGAGTLRFALG